MRSLAERNIGKRKKELEKYLAKFPEQKKLAEVIAEYLKNDFIISDERSTFGATSYIRKWERETSKIEEEKIRELAKAIAMSNKMVDILVAKVILTQSQNFTSSHYSYSQKRLDLSYFKVLCGYYGFFREISKKFKST